MKAAQINGFGEPQDVVKEVDDAPKPTAAADQVLVEVQAAAVNPFDVKLVGGMYTNMDIKFPMTPGGDVAGIVAEAANGFKAGDEVYGQANAVTGHGSLAEFTPVKAESLAVKPKSVDFATAAALPLAGCSAIQALVDTMDLQSGQKILIHGGGGGIGSLAIQIAKNLGAYVATTATGEGIDFVKSLGADEVIDYQAQDFSEIIKDYDAVYDTVGGETTTKSYSILKPGGKLVSMLTPPDDMLAKQYQIEASLQGSKVTTERLNRLAELVDNGAVKAHVEKVFPLPEAGQAMSFWKNEHPRGKVVVAVR